MLESGDPLARAYRFSSGPHLGDLSCGNWMTEGLAAGSRPTPVPGRGRAPAPPLPTNYSSRFVAAREAAALGPRRPPQDSYLVDSASSHMLVSKIKPCMSKYKQLYGETANGSLNQLSFI